MEYPGITIVSQDNNTVTFGVSQTLEDDYLCEAWTYYQSTPGNEYVCPGVERVGPGEFGLYTANCVNGEAFVDVYFYDGRYSDLNKPGIPEICEPLEGGTRTLKFSYRLPCDLGDTYKCPPPPDLVCEEAVDEIVFDNFEEDGQDYSWVFGLLDEDSSGNHYLVVNVNRTEVSKTFKIPPETASVVLEFVLIELDGWSPDDMAFARIGNKYMNLGSFSPDMQDELKAGYFEDIDASIQSTGLGCT